MMLHDWFLDSARRYPDETALIVDGHALTYAALEAASATFASGVAPGLRVGLLATRTVTAYAAYLGVLRAGGVVVPLDASQPAARLADVARTAGLSLVIADDGQDTTFLDTTFLDVPRVAPATHPNGHVDRPGRPDDLAYLLFTSGSTGRPKGVPIRHRNLDDFLRFNIDRYRVGPGCRLSQTFHLAFDPSVFDMFVAWGGGATLVVASADDLFDPAAFVNRHRITHWYSVPSLISVACDADLLPAGCMPTLRWSLFAGDQFTLAQARAWAAAAPASTLENLYGPTELSVTVTAYRLPRSPQEWPATENDTVPIGQVYPHLEYRVDADGELQVRGPQRFAGYHDPADNEGRFVGADGVGADGVGVDGVGADAPLDPGPAAWYRTGDRVGVHGRDLVHLGRLDHQIKIRGYRVELPEIEGALRKWAGAESAVVHAQTLPDGGVELVALCSGPVPPLRQVRELLRPHLPLHMIPRRVVCLDQLPRTDRGKIDRAACAALLSRELV